MTSPARPPRGWTRRHWLQGLPWAGPAALPGVVQARGALAAGAQAGAAAAAPAPVEWPVLYAPDGRPVDSAGWRGVPLVVVFWATWCGFCERHNVHVEKLHRSLDPARLRVLGVALDRDGAAVQHYLRQRDYRFPVVLEGGRLRGRFTARRTVPMTCTLGADGRLRQCIPGEMSEDDVLELARLALPAER